MKIKHDPIIIDPENPFSNCKLDREKYAKILSVILSSNNSGFVLAINNQWGTGKTTFIKMWQKQLELKKFNTIYFNSWENDFDVDPLIAIMSEFNNLIKKEKSKTFKSLLSKGATLTKKVLPALLKTAIKKHTGSDDLSDLAENSAEGFAEILEEEIKNYSTKQKGLIEFREILERFIKENSNGKPIVFLIDELDRCRPNYAVKLLEQVKHLFTVPGIIFVLSIDKIQLGYAVRGVYGNDNINSDEYLRRFIDLEYSIPEPNTRVFCSYLYDYFEFKTFFQSSKRENISEFKNDKEILISLTSLLFEKARLTLRQQEKLFSQARVGLFFFEKDNYVLPQLYFSLIFIKNINKIIYDNIRLKLYTPQQLINEFSKLIPKTIDDEQITQIIHVEALLAFTYNNSLSKHKTDPIFENNGTNDFKVTLKSQLDTIDDQPLFSRFINYYHKDWNLNHVSLDFLIKKIDLIDDITIN